jgi:putative ABC transport system permease protein
VIDRAGFEALGIPIVAGRAFDDRPGGGETPLVISADLAARVWPGQRALGRRLSANIYGTLTGEVIGIVPPAHLRDPRTPARPVVFLPSARFASSQRDVIIRADGDPAAIAPALRSLVASLDDGLPLYLMAPFPDLLRDALAADRFTSLMLAAFATAALMLAGLGVFGVCAVDAAARRREIGVRLALGSPQSRVVAAVLAPTARRAGAGLIVGSVTAVLGARAMQPLLFGITPADPVSLMMAIAAVIVLVTLATVWPALRASRGNPLTVLRDEST